MSEKQKIEELTTEGLGKLFPIEIAPYDKNWKETFRAEKEYIQRTLGSNITLRIEHFGSTSIEGLAAKPTIDILIEIPPLTNELKELIIQKMKGIDYNFIWRTDEQTPYMNFVKGYTLKGYKENIFHVHMGDKTHSLWTEFIFVII